MPNGKLRLNLADLRLKSFETTESPPSVRGTVKGMEQCTGCTNWSGSGCQMTYCDDGGASQSESCDFTWMCGTWYATECYDTCYEETCAYTCTGPCPNGTCVDTCAATCQYC
ncbi:MAG TPA: hypothetical protein VNP72_00410 [Longimicrobium sp.]|nr:hypothetical protein [Longimicrobium sp.]